jgi:hypothetical protein
VRAGKNNPGAVMGRGKQRGPGSEVKNKSQIVKNLFRLH